MKECMNTKRYGMAVKVKEGQKKFYIENHAKVWPEVLSELKKIKINNYSIFLKDNFLFGYLEYKGNSFDIDMEEMQKIPVVKKWTNLMIDCFDPFPGHEGNKSWVAMDEIFHLD